VALDGSVHSVRCALDRDAGRDVSIFVQLSLADRAFVTEAYEDAARLLVPALWAVHVVQHHKYARNVLFVLMQRDS
jgi:hypothetical protein